MLNPTRSLIAPLLCVAGAASAQITITPVIVPGQAAPGSPSGTFNGPQPPAIQAFGKFALQAFLTNTPNPGFDNSGVWQAGPMSGVSVVAILGGSVPGAGRNWNGVGHPTQNRAGGSLFAGVMDGSATSDRALFYSASGGAAGVAVQEADPAPGIAGAFIGDIGLEGIPSFALNDSGRVVFLAPLTGVATGNRAIFTGDAATRAYSLVARQGEPSPLPGGALMSFITEPSINARGDVAFFTNLNAPPSFTMLWKPMGGTLQAAVSAGDPAPGFPPGSIITTIVGQNGGAPPQFNDNGVFAVAAAVGPNFPNSFGVWRGAPGALQLIAKKGDQAPGAQAGAQFNDFRPLLNRSGAVLFYSNLSAGASSAGIWIAPPNQAPELLTLLNAQAPDMPMGTLITSISNGGIGFNNRGEGLVNASLNYAVNFTPANGIFAGRAGRLRKVVAAGDNLEVSPGVFRTAFNIQCWTYNGPDMGRQTPINDRGEVAFSCQFVGGGGGAFIAQLPHPCPGDATGDDVVDFIDLNIILSQFGMVGVGLAGDLNGDGTVDFLDLNAVLSFFGGAC